MPRLSDTICADHKDLKSYYDQIVQAEDEDEQSRWQNMLTWELARHVVGEEIVLYPALKQHLNEDAAEDRQQHQMIKEKLAVFQNLKARDPRFVPTMAILMDDLAAHVIHEERVDLINLESAISEEESNNLAVSFDRTKDFVPTRAHPSAPDRPPYQTAVGLITAPLDYLQDLFRKWPDSEFTPNAPAE
ncbi:hemerythrin HHE cation binding domain-containing protein [Penicillium angulare]|uniref:hemerythrin HHE cation binding domain-containing protein n=1 Tax=Penicillium angulare TaxID=116970 RepID=UPI00253FCD62|nr:hemerythrin HHE cation binding domain-containing protein [Penicillium angulare]KAJ5280705.1 hemerythrin HHE cation binding domain-containing protein [Penicillium angulare]